jgi:hypothetical protein
MKDNIKKIDRAISRFLYKVVPIGRENYALWKGDTTQEFKELEKEFEHALLKQTSELLRKKAFWEDIRENMQKVDVGFWEEEFGEEFEGRVDITSEDLVHIRESITRHIPPSTNYLAPTVIYGAYSYFANLGGQSFLDKAGIDRKFQAEQQELQSRMVARADTLIMQTEKTTQDWLARMITDGRRDGMSYPQIANNIRHKIPETYQNRAVTIARTEMAELVNDYEFRAARMNGAVSKTWRAAGENVCEVCMSYDGEEVGMDTMYEYKLGSGEKHMYIRPPAHPNCKCLLDYDIPITMRGEWLDRNTSEEEWNRMNSDLDRLYHRASDAKRELDRTADELSAQFPGTKVAKAPLKGRSRSLEKTIAENKGDVFQLTDIARNTIVTESQGQTMDVYKIANELGNKYNIKIQETSLGYKGINTKIISKTGHIMEMQITTDKMIYAKEKEKDAIAILGKDVFERIARETKQPAGLGHMYYEEYRNPATSEKRKAELEIISSKYYKHFY